MMMYSYMQSMMISNSNDSNNNDSNSNSNNTDTIVPTFDEFVAAPDGLDTGGLSFGSVTMTDAEMVRLQATMGAGASTGPSSFHARQAAMRGSANRSSSGYTNHSIHHHHRQDLPQQRYHHDDDLAPPGGLEPMGTSFGDVSMASAGTNHMRLEDPGASIGTTMSYLEAIGTSFGSLSLDASNRDYLFRALELAAAGPEVPPMFPSEEKAHGNLLECSDTESEDSDDREELVKQKTQAWEIMKSQVSMHGTGLRPDVSRGSIASHDLMPPPPAAGASKAQQQQQLVPPGSPFVHTEVAVPTTMLENNFSTLSAWTAADDFDDVGGDGGAGAPHPPQALRKEDSW